MTLGGGITITNFLSSGSFSARSALASTCQRDERRVLQKPEASHHSSHAASTAFGA